MAAESLNESAPTYDMCPLLSANVGQPEYTQAMMDPPVRRAGHTAPRTARIEIRVTEAAKASLQAMAAKEERSFSDMVRLVLMRGMQ